MAMSQVATTIAMESNKINQQFHSLRELVGVPFHFFDEINFILFIFSSFGHKLQIRSIL